MFEQLIPAVADQHFVLSGGASAHDCFKQPRPNGASNSARRRIAENPRGAAACGVLFVVSQNDLIFLCSGACAAYRSREWTAAQALPTPVSAAMYAPPKGIAIMGFIQRTAEKFFGGARPVRRTQIDEKFAASLIEKRRQHDQHTLCSVRQIQKCVARFAREGGYGHPEGRHVKFDDTTPQSIRPYFHEAENVVMSSSGISGRIGRC